MTVGVGEAARYSVVVWNVAGRVESEGADLVVFDDSACGSPPHLLKYSSLPPKQEGKDSLVLVTHGWSRDIPGLADTPDDSVPWLNELADAINGHLAQKRITNWQVVAYEWLTSSFTLWPDWAADNGYKEGANVGIDIVHQGWSHVHLIGNSAGAALIQGAADMINGLDSTKAIVVHETFLDPYLQVSYAGGALYGTNADWADCYFAHDLMTDEAGSLVLKPSLTEGSLAHAYNVDVTQLDPSAWIIPAYCGNLLDPLRVCGLEVVSSHQWPHRFYANTVSGSQAGAEGLGFPLSKEGGGWDETSPYRRGDEPRVLGNLGMVVRNDIKAVVKDPLALGQFVWQASASGVVRVLGNSLQLLTGLGGGSSVDLHQPKEAGGMPVWISFAVPVTNQVSFVAFEAQFDSAEGSVGLLAVYWGTNLIGTVDERVVVPGQQRYSFGLPQTAPAGLYRLGFRLDPHSEVPSSINVTNIALGFSGIATPIQLQIAKSPANWNPTITLTAASGFYYQLQSSPDLVNWVPLASVLNTNGTAQIVDPTPPSSQQRFYRVAVP